ncbi:hypothetical protein [Streptomyces sp. AS13]|uniref:hypothetical protein n=1 Tax=Streptomyces sp. AS13 TaxID=3038080 RepID=UPI00278C2262|nr:hypothetical protein [Streptomyces sp. AS13]
MTDFNELIPIILQMLPHMLALFDRPVSRALVRRSRRIGVRPPDGPVTAPAAEDGAALLELVRGMPPGTVLRYEAPDGTVLTCWSAPGAQPGEYRLW